MQWTEKKAILYRKLTKNKFRSIPYYETFLSRRLLDWGSLDHTNKLSLQLPRSPALDAKKGKFDLAGNFEK